MKRLLAVSLTSLLLVGCGTTSQNTSVVQNENANVTMAEAASTISDSLTEADAMQRATIPPLSMKKLPDAESYGMDQLATIDWSGPVGPIVARIADASQFKLRVLGEVPALPVLVSIDKKDKPLGDILRDIDYQAGSKANIIVYPDDRVIELRYARS